ncbi:hypothetical protein L6164_026887 [Bauhinia variegata]|uniref:Uncharacterized protein n=1 Tax=Bauhinia variegata TaxID=167791 RepID=A0ACB9LRB1_BAUVA|nr:hypothetical protein L6164_026887 [Bauhinia variegata]
MSEKYCCMILRLNIDCNSCCRKLRRIILRMKEVESHMIERQQRRLIVCGRFVPADLSIKIRKKMNRRVEILEVQDFGAENENEQQNAEKPAPRVVEEKPSMVVYPGQVPVYPDQVPVYPGQVPYMQPTMPMAY